ncbi:MAG: hypothetical protein K6G81_00625 [Lachnospiraceae bacterium]|nr:hypothetical protein [Lachnospiraceae bacterium]
MSKENEQAVSAELTDEEMDNVSGGRRQGNNCPNVMCQSTRNPIKKGNKIVCPDCGYCYGTILQNDTLA